MEPPERLVMTRADGRDMAIRRYGIGPTVVCLAGGPGADAAYLEDLGGLDRSFRLVVPDMRGTGASAPAGGASGYAYDALAADVAALRRYLGLERMALLAHSAACTTALVYAARHVDAIQALVLVSPSRVLLDDVGDDTGDILARRSDEPWYPEAVAARARLSAGAGPEQLPSLLHALAPASYARWGERERAHAAVMQPADVEPSLRFWDAGVDAESVRAGLTRLHAPVLVVTGDLDAATGVAAGAAWASVLPRARRVGLDGAAHIPWVDAPEAFAVAVSTFLSPVLT